MARARWCPATPPCWPNGYRGMLADSAALKAMGAAGRASVARRYDWARIAQHLEQVYAAVASGRRDFG